MKRIIYILFAFSLLLSAQEKSTTTFFLSADSLEKNGRVFPADVWKYHPGDNLEWANPNFNDSAWVNTTSTRNPFENPKGEFPGKAWFRLKVVVDSSLVNKPLAFNVWIPGAAEFFVNGKKTFSYGKIFENDEIENDNPAFPNIIIFEKSENILAVRYYNDMYEEMTARSFTPGFFLQFEQSNNSISNRYDYLSGTKNIRNVFLTVAIVLALLHLFLFLFDRSQKQNLFYVLFLFSFSLFLYINLSPLYGRNVQLMFLLYRFSPTALIITILFGSTTIYSIYREIKPNYKFIVIVGLLLGYLGYFIDSIWIWYLTYAYITGISVWGSRVLYNPKFSRKSASDWVLRIGFGLMGAMGVYQMLISLNIFEPIAGIRIPFIYGVILFILAMSISLAYDYVKTSKNLKKKLKEIKELSEKTLQQELAAKEMEIEKRILEADNKRKTDELEAARSVQLAMLPQCLNDIEGLDICFEMHPATEVGGDYYDYKVADDGTLNLVVGDATGHGMKAGIMVATIKSLFSALGIKMMIPDFFHKCTEIIKSMSLGNLFMSMTFIRMKDGRVFGSAAGMPPILVYRKDKNEVESIVIKSMPLGASLDFPYNTFEADLSSGDVILLMSDGYTELFNSQKEMLGIERVKEYFKESAHKSSNDLVQELISRGNQWRKEHPQEDDVTFVAIKKR